MTSDIIDRKRWRRYGNEGEIKGKDPKGNWNRKGWRYWVNERQVRKEMKEGN